MAIVLQCWLLHYSMLKKLRQDSLSLLLRNVYLYQQLHQQLLISIIIIIIMSMLHDMIVSNHNMCIKLFFFLLCYLLFALKI